MATTSFDLNVRYEIYRFFTENCKAPSYQEIAGAMGEAEARRRASFHMSRFGSFQNCGMRIA